MKKELTVISTLSTSVQPVLMVVIRTKADKKERLVPQSMASQEASRKFKRRERKMMMRRRTLNSN